MNPLLNWNADDSLALRNFLAQCPRFIPMLKDARPKCEGKTIEERAVTGSERQGADNLIDYIENHLSAPNPKRVERPFISEE